MLNTHCCCAYVFTTCRVLLNKHVSVVVVIKLAAICVFLGRFWHMVGVSSSSRGDFWGSYLRRKCRRRIPRGHWSLAHRPQKTQIAHYHYFGRQRPWIFVSPSCPREMARREKTFKRQVTNWLPICRKRTTCNRKRPDVMYKWMRMIQTDSKESRLKSTYAKYAQKLSLTH